MSEREKSLQEDANFIKERFFNPELPTEGRKRILKAIIARMQIVDLDVNRDQGQNIRNWIEQMYGLGSVREIGEGDIQNIHITLDDISSRVFKPIYDRTSREAFVLTLIDQSIMIGETRRDYGEMLLKSIESEMAQPYEDSILVTAENGRIIHYGGRPYTREVMEKHNIKTRQVS